MDPRSSIAEKAARIGRSAAALVRRVRTLGLLGLICAIWLWLVLFVFLGSIPHFLVAFPAAAIGLILLLPGIVVLLTTLGLSSIGQLPGKLGQEITASPAPTHRRGPIQLLRRLWAIRREVLNYKTVLIGYAGAIRLFTLPVLLLISLAVLACVFQIILALISLPLLLLSLLI